MGASMAIRSPFRYGHQHDGCQAQGKGVADRDMTATVAVQTRNGFTDASPATSAFGGKADIDIVVRDFRE